MSTKTNIQNFIRELADYINNFIVGTENTVITQCEVMDQPMNRGHAIPIRVKHPEGITDGAMVGPCYYAEELMAENKGSTIAAIAERLNIEVNGLYGNMVRLMKIQAEAAKKTLWDYDQRSVILTALPTENVITNSGDPKRPFIEKKFLDLTVSLKAEVLSVDKEGGMQGYFMPIMEDPDCSVSKEEWEQAKLNALTKANIAMMIIPTPEDEGKIPVCGEIRDTAGFFDYFYMLAAKPIWESIMRDLNADWIYIFPNGAYSAKFIVVNNAVESNDTAKALRQAFMEAAVVTMNGLKDIYVVDRDTLEIKKLEEKKNEDK